MKKQSVDVLDAADEFERKLRWLDFKSEQTRLLVYDPDAEWNVGDHLYDGPTNHSTFGVLASLHSLTNFHDYAVDAYWEQSFDTSASPRHNEYFCQECEVWTPYEEEACWYCADTFEDPTKYIEKHQRSAHETWVDFDIDRNQYRVSLDVAMYVLPREEFVEYYRNSVRLSRMMFSTLERAFSGMSPALARVGEQLLVYSSAMPQERVIREYQFSIYDEADGWTPVMRYEPPEPAQNWYEVASLDRDALLPSRLSAAPESLPEPRDFDGDTRIFVLPENVSTEPSVPLPGPVFATPNWESQQALTAGPPVDQWIDGRSRRRRT